MLDLAEHRFSHHGIALLANPADANAFADASFKLGLKERSSYLGDPTTRTHIGSPKNWKVGGPKNEADIVLILASDHPEVLDGLVALLKPQADASDLDLIFEQRGDTLSGDLRGHEHFGFKDGISQPGVRGKLSATPGDYITPRYISATDSRRLYTARPGQLLFWPGQVLLGRTAARHRAYLQSPSPRHEPSEVGGPRLLSRRSPPEARRSRLL